MNFPSRREDSLFLKVELRSVKEEFVRRSAVRDRVAGSWNIKDTEDIEEIESPEPHHEPQRNQRQQLAENSQ